MDGFFRAVFLCAFRAYPSSFFIFSVLGILVRSFIPYSPLFVCALFLLQFKHLLITHLLIIMINDGLWELLVHGWAGHFSLETLRHGNSNAMLPIVSTTTTSGRMDGLFFPSVFLFFFFSFSH